MSNFVMTADDQASARTRMVAESTTRECVSHTIAGLIQTHQEHVRPVLRQIERLTVRVVRSHGLKHCQLTSLVQHLVDFIDELHEDLHGDEAELFPLLLQCKESALFESTAEHLQKRLRELEDDHHALSQRFAIIRAITSDYSRPADACHAYIALLDSLVSLELTLRRHWHVEENLVRTQIDTCLHAETSAGV